MVFASTSGFSFTFGGDGCGTSVSRPCGVVGVITINMMIRTSSTSISGTMFGSEIAPLLPPTAIPMGKLLYPLIDSLVPGSPCSRRCRRRRSARLRPILFSEQADLIHACRSHFVHRLHHVSVLGALVRAHEDSFVQAVSQEIFHFSSYFAQAHLRTSQEQMSIARDSHDDGIILIRLLHVLGVIYLGHIYRHAFLQHRRHDHENN